MTMLEVQTPGDRLIVVIGSINMDLVVRNERMPEPGETVMGLEFTTVHGGKGANQAVGVARLGERCVMVGRVGCDVFGHRLVKHLSDEKIDTTEVKRIDNCSSGVAVINIDGSGENAITVVSGANGKLSPDDILDIEPLIARAKVVLMQLEIPVATVCMAAALARRHGVYTILDTAPVPKGGLPEELYNVDMLSPNRTEAISLTGERVQNVAEAKLVGAELVRRGAAEVVIKLGESGAVIVTDKGIVEHVAGFAVNVVDTTAAGDAFMGAVAVGKARGFGIVESVVMGCGAGAFAVSRFGAQDSMPVEAALKRILHNGDRL